MIKRLHLKDCFKHKDTVFDFETGLTTITGPNESGKSLILEMVRYCLFGAKALRGSVTDHKKTYAKLDFQVMGHGYAVERQNGKATLTSGDETLATGTTAVNAAILKILGYDLTVFDVANACNQGAVEALGNMRPAERKNMVDQTIGLTAVDDCIETVGAEANAFRKLAESLSEGLVEPVHPVEPVGYQTSATLRETEGLLRRDSAEFQTLSGWLTRPAPRVHAAPECNTGDTVEHLEEHEQRRRDHDRDLAVTRAELAALPVAPHDAKALEALEQHLAAWEAWAAARDFLSTQVQPEFTRTQLEAMRATWKLLGEFHDRESLVDKICHLQAKGHHTCPECDHEWPFEEASIQHLQDELAAFIPLMGLAKPVAPLLTFDQIDFEESLIENWEAGVEERKRCQSISKAPEVTYTHQDLMVFQAQLKAAEGRPAAQAKVAALEAQESLQDRSADLTARRAYEERKRAYDLALAEHQAYEAEAGVKRTRLAELAGVVERHQEANVALQDALLFERALQEYHTAWGAYMITRGTVIQNLKDAEEHEKARKALRILKSRVKAYLVPSLNSVASRLLSAMTNGERNSIVINEEFEITVDGQPINTLSGSGKAVANLAIRVGLGQVLTNRVFSVFMGDEIDASMDANRADYTATCFQNLAESIGQVIMVSHKTPEADHYIQL